MFFLRWWGPALAWAGVIFQASTARFSSEHTAGVVLTLLRMMMPHAKDATLDAVHVFIRKCAHVFEYFVFGLLLLRAVRGPKKGWKLRWALVALAIAAGYAASDEFHQIFVPGRGPSVWDALLDTAAAGLAQWAAFRLIARGGHALYAAGDVTAKRDSSLRSE